MPRSRRSFRFAWEAYALSAIDRLGFVRGRPLPWRGTLELRINLANIGESPPWPVPRRTTSSSILASHSAWIFVVEPTRDRLSA